MSYECDNDNHDPGCQCPGLPGDYYRPQYRQWLDNEIAYARRVYKDNPTNAFYTHGRLQALVEAQAQYEKWIKGQLDSKGKP